MQAVRLWYARTLVTLRLGRSWYTSSVPEEELTANPEPVKPLPVGTLSKANDVSAQQFIAFTAREMQVPISVLGWNLDRLRRVLGSSADGGDLGRVLERLFEANIRLTTLVEDLLNLEKLQRGAFRVHLRPVQLTEVVRKALQTAEREAERRGVTLSWSWKTGDIPLTRGDLMRLHEVVQNLVGNGIKYTPRGGHVTVKIRRTSEVAPAAVPLLPNVRREGDFVLVSVEDTGMGIPAEEQPRVFQQFFRGRKALSAAEGGTGLGLYLVRTIVSQHGGMTWFTSREGHGSTFFFTLPVAEPYGEAGGGEPSP